DSDILSEKREASAKEKYRLESDQGWAWVFGRWKLFMDGAELVNVGGQASGVDHGTTHVEEFDCDCPAIFSRKCRAAGCSQRALQPLNRRRQFSFALFRICS